MAYYRYLTPPITKISHREKMPPRGSREPALMLGDKVSVAVRHFGEEYARERGGARWSSDTVRDEALVLEKSNGKYLLDFTDGEEKRWWARKDIKFVSRDSQRSRTRQVDHSSDSDDHTDDEAAEHDSSSSAADGEEQAQEDDDGGAVDGWIRNDDQCMDERAKHGFHVRGSPSWNTCPASCTRATEEDDPSSYFFDVCLSWFDKPFFDEMADLMQETGRGKGAAWGSWRVTTEDLWQWLGVWFYMLAFEENADRRAYFSAPGKFRRFGPRHVVEETLLRGKNGAKGVKWFENMLCCFSLPTRTNTDNDPFMQTRHMWESCRKVFANAVSPGWLITLDESMVKWLGKNMPGLMVVPRKPTPVGLEVHTLCCSLSGIMVNFEVYEGKEAMEKKEYVNKLTDVGAINKSTTLTLRCVKPYFSTVQSPLLTHTMCSV